MKKILLILLLTIPFIGFSQDISGTGWKIYDEDGDRRIIFFEDDGTFTYLNVTTSWNEGSVYGNDDETWEVKDGNKIVLLLNDGYKIMTGTINRTGDYISGTLINREGITDSWTGELIKF